VATRPAAGNWSRWSQVEVDPVGETTMMEDECHQGGPDSSRRETQVHTRVQGRGGRPRTAREERRGARSGPRPDSDRSQGLGAAS
jgi:hypothetical protein